jgi:hypothetical protein
MQDITSVKLSQLPFAQWAAFCLPISMLLWCLVLPWMSPFSLWRQAYCLWMASCRTSKPSDDRCLYQFFSSTKSVLCFCSLFIGELCNRVWWHQNCPFSRRCWIANVFFLQSLSVFVSKFWSCRCLDRVHSICLVSAPWLFHNDCDYSWPLNKLSHSDLLCVAHTVGAVGRLWKANLIQLLVHDFVISWTVLLDLIKIQIK